MKLGKKRPTRKNSNSWSKSGTHQGYDVTIQFMEQFAQYSFQVSKGSDKYDSGWDQKFFDTEDVCIKACENYILEVRK